MRRGGLTLLELVVASGLLAGFLVLFWLLWSAVNREGAHVEERSELMDAAVVLQETLTWDLHRSLALDVLPAAARPRERPAATLVLPLYAGYLGTARPALRYRRLEYRHDPEGGRLVRAGEPLITGVAAVRFTWTEGPPCELEVVLTGARTVGHEAPSFAFRLPAPAGTDAAAMWRWAARHQGAEELPEPPEDPR